MENKEENKMNGIVLEEIFEGAGVPFNPDEWSAEEQASLCLYLQFIQALARNGCPREAILATTCVFYNEDGSPKTETTLEMAEQIIMTLLENGCPEEALEKAGQELYSALTA